MKSQTLKENLILKFPLLLYNTGFLLPERTLFTSFTLIPRKNLNNNLKQHTKQLLFPYSKS